MKLTTPTGFILTFLAACAIIAGVWFGFTKPQIETLDRITAERDENLTKVSYFQENISAINETGVDTLGLLFGQVQKVDALLPQRIDLGTAASTYPALASSFGLESKFDAGKATASYQPFQVTLTGSYSSISAFLDSLQTANNLITVGSFSLAPAGSTESSSGNFTATMELRFHTIKEPPLRAATGS